MSEAMTLEEREASIGGIGTARKRKEDARFIRGKGNYVDDIKLKGMLHGDFVRSSHAHALIKSIDTEAALKVPGVLAVVTAKELEPLSLHWMPTLAGDMAAVLADKKVHFQNQEIAFVVATDRYAATDGVQKVEVEYEALPPLIDPKTALDDDAPVIRDDVAETTRSAREAPPPEPHFRVAGRRQGCERRRLRGRRGHHQGRDRLSALPPGALGDVLLRRRYGRGERQAHGLWHLPGAPRRAHRGLADNRPDGKATSALSRPISAAVSATRSAPIRAISARRRPRSSPAIRSSGSRAGSTIYPPPPSPATIT